MAVELQFVGGTLELRGLPAVAVDLPAACLWDPRSRCHRAPAVAYAELILALIAADLDYHDAARSYGELGLRLQVRPTPRPYQSDALAAWRQSRGRGVVVLPTGAGKSHVALLAMDAVQRDTLVVAPTLDLVAQWYDLIRTSFRCDVGVVGGGEYHLDKVTVTTYDSAHLHMEHFGNRFGLVVFDECHHLPGDAYSMAALSCLAPYRLGLSATPERADGRHGDLEHLVGATVLRRDVGELAGDYLADYRVEQIRVELTEEERQAYEEARAIYRAFVVRQGIRMSRPDGWAQFIMRSSVSEEGRRAMAAYQRQRQLAFAAPSKLAYVEHLLHLHRRDRVLLFTESNRPAYEMARRFLVPIITHQTRVSERSAILEGLARGTYNAIATSRVLNEGVDIPCANVGIVISGSGSVREHVQRLGRLLRRGEGKRAVLYELVASNTSEEHTSQRRREHSAYH
jgi:superfamily II DNA or RNA helicase